MSTVRIDAESHERLKRLAAEEHCSLQDVLHKALERYEEARFFARLSEDFEKLANSPEDWQDYVRDAAAWDPTLMDGLERE